MEKYSVKKPFSILVMVIVIMILGFVSLTEMTTDLLPKMSLPYMLVITTYPGASPEKVETAVCEPMESALGTINGVKNVYSISYENYGIVELEFVDGTDMDSAMVKLSSALDTVKAILPDECGSPSIMELSMDMMASIYAAVSVEGVSDYEASRYIEDNIIPYIERQEGITKVTKIGLVEKSIQVELNADKVDVLNDKILAKTNDAFKEAVEKLEDAKKQLDDSQKKLDDGKKELVDAKKELEDGKSDLLKNQFKLDDSKTDMDNQKAEFEKQKKETTEKLAQATEIVNQLNSYKTHLTAQQASKTATETAIAKIKEAIPAEETIAALTALKNSIDGDNGVIKLLSASSGALSDVEKGALSGILAGLSQAGIDTSALDINSAPRETIIASLTAYAGAIKTNLDTIDSFKKQLKDYEASLTTIALEIQVTEGIIAGYEEKLTAMGLTYADVEKAKIEAAAGFGSAQAQIASGEAAIKSAQEQLDKGKESLEDAEKQIDDSWKTINDSEKQLKDGWEDYYEAVENYEIQKAEALRKANANQLVSIDTLSSLIYAQNFAMPAGYVDDKYDNSWLVKVGTNYESVEELTNIVLTNIEDIGDVKLSDVADVTVIDNSMDSYAKLDGESAVILSIFKSSTSGTNEVSKNFVKAVSEIEERFEGVSVLTLMDQGDYITMIIKGVLQSMIVGAALAIVVLAIFLKDVKPTLVVAVSIPLSVLTAIVLMYFSGISLNMMSLSGLALGIGMLVDNSIVVIENIYRLRTKGVGAARAAVQGTKQVSGAIIASTMTTVCVFAPMVFSKGTVRELMMPISLSIIFTLVASLLIAMTVVPATGSTILKNSKEKKHPWFDKISDLYAKSLNFCLNVKIVPLAIAIGLLTVSIIAVLKMGIVMIPEITANQLQVNVTMPEDADKDTCYATADEILAIIMDVEGVGSTGVMSGGETALFATTSEVAFDTYSYMIIPENKNAGEQEIKRISNDIIERTKHLDCTVKTEAGMGEMADYLGSGISLQVYGDELDDILVATEQIMDVMKSVEGIDEVTNGQDDPDQVIHLTLNKDAAMRCNLTAAQIFQAINGKISSTKTAATITVDGVDMDIVVKDNMEPITKENLMDYNFEVATTDDNGNTVTVDHPLSDFAKIQIEDGVTSINRMNQSRYMTVTATVKEGYNATLISRELEPLLDEIELPRGVKIDNGGEADSVKQMLVQMGKVIAMGLAFIYLVMVVQFQSLLSPFIVLFTVPLAFTGGLLGLLGMQEPLSVMGMMGFVVLLGTVVNNGIVFVDYVNQLRIGGLSRRDALIATGKTRMRPILMTALTTILAMVSLMFGDDISSQMSKGMAIVVAGGLAYATLMTLYIIPVMYDILFKKQPLLVDVGSDNLDDIPDDAADYLMEKAKRESHNKVVAKDKTGESDKTDKSTIDDDLDIVDLNDIDDED